MLESADLYNLSGAARIDALLNDALRRIEDHTDAMFQTDAVFQLAEDAASASAVLNYGQGAALATLVKGMCRYLQAQYAEARPLLDSARKQFQQLGNDQLLAETVLWIGDTVKQQADYARAKDCYEESLAGFTRLNDKLKIARSLQRMALISRYFVDYAKAIEYAYACLAVLADFSGDDAEAEKNRARAFNILGNSYDEIGEWHTALNYHFRSLTIFERGGQPRRIATALECIANVHHHLGEYNTALEYHARALKLAEESDDKYNQGTFLLNIGSAYVSLKNYPRALSSYMKAFALQESLCDLHGQAFTLEGLGELYAQLNDRTKSCEFFEQSLRLFNEIAVPREAADAAQKLAGVLIAEERFQEAFERLDFAFDIAEKQHIKSLLMHVHERYAEAFRTQGDAKNAAAHYEHFSRLDKELLNDDVRHDAARLTLRYEFEATKRQPMSLISSDDIDKVAVLMYAAPAPEKHDAITVKTFGMFELTLGERTLSKDNWQRKKARDVFKYLLINYGRAVTTDELADALWQSSADSVAPALKTALSHIRKALEPSLAAYQHSRYLKTLDHAYQLDFGQHATIDFIDFKQLLQRATLLDGATKLAALEDAVTLYRGDFLSEDAYEDWTTFERESLKDACLKTYLALADLYAAPEKKESCLRKALALDRIYEPAYEKLFQLFRASHRAADVKKLYDDCLAAYKRDLNTKPPEKFKRFAKG
jgi:two-component SAPR family response regulator